MRNNSLFCFIIKRDTYTLVIVTESLSVYGASANILGVLRNTDAIFYGFPRYKIQIFQSYITYLFVVNEGTGIGD